MPQEPLAGDHPAAGALVDELPADVAEVQRGFEEIGTTGKIDDAHAFSTAKRSFSG